MYAGDQAWRWVNSIPWCGPAGLRSPLFPLSLTLTFTSHSMLAAVVVLVAIFTVPETYPGVILQREAQRLEKETSMPHVSIYDHGRPKMTAFEALQIGLRRPFVFLVRLLSRVRVQTPELTG